MGQHLGQGKGAAGVVSVGRVQSATLRMVVERDNAIAHFKPINHFTVSIHAANAQWPYTPPTKVEPGTGRAFDDNDKVYFTDRGQADAFANAIKPLSLHVASLKAGQLRKNPPLPHSLTSLQRVMSKSHGLSAGETLKLADQIRLDGYLTYPRTEHGELPASLYNADDLGSALAACTAISSLSAAAKAMQKAHPAKERPACYVDKPMEHHAIIPTGKMPPVGSWSAKELAVFTECAKAFVVALHPAALYNTLSADGTVETQGLADEKPAHFKRTWRQLITPGYLALTGKEADADEAGNDPSDDGVLPTLEQGKSYKIEQANVEAKQTKPPKPYTEAGLLGAMLNAGRQTTGDAAKILAKASGIGTPATRAAILDTLEKREYIHRKKTITATEKGHDLISHVPADLASVVTTATWESQLADIEDAPSDQAARSARDTFLREQIAFVTARIQDIITATQKAGGPRLAGSGKPSEKMIGLINLIADKLKVDPGDARDSFPAAKAFIDQHMPTLQQQFHRPATAGKSKPASAKSGKKPSRRKPK